MAIELALSPKQKIEMQRTERNIKNKNKIE
jgi:hypothetical protein